MLCKSKEQIYRYQIGNYRIEIIVDDDLGEFESWLSRKDLGISIMMFGISYEQMLKNGNHATLKDFKDLVIANWEDYIPVLLNTTL